MLEIQKRHQLAPTGQVDAATDSVLSAPIPADGPSANSGAQLAPRLASHSHVADDTAVGSARAGSIPSASRWRRLATSEGPKTQSEGASPARSRLPRRFRRALAAPGPTHDGYYVPAFKRSDYIQKTTERLINQDAALLWSCAGGASQIAAQTNRAGAGRSQLETSTQRFLDFVVIYSTGSLTFAESEGGPPLWVIDRTTFSGQPSLNIKTQKILKQTTTTFVLSNAVYPGTNLPADLSIDITESPGDEFEPPEQTVDLSLALGNASFHWEFRPVFSDPQTQTDPFLEWLKGRGTVAVPISLEGTVVAFASGGGISFGPAATATLNLAPGTLAIEGDGVCTADIVGISFTGSSLAVSALNPPHTELVVQATSPISLPLPSPTPLGSLTARPGFSVVKVYASEIRKSATFSQTNFSPLYALEQMRESPLLRGVPSR